MSRVKSRDYNNQNKKESSFRRFFYYNGLTFNYSLVKLILGIFILRKNNKKREFLLTKDEYKISKKFINLKKNQQNDDKAIRKISNEFNINQDEVKEIIKKSEEKVKDATSKSLEEYIKSIAK